MIKNNTYNVIVKRGRETDNMDVKAKSETDAKRIAIDLFYFDGWHAVSAKEKVEH
tara:strand:- start:468 stop:632 length:165 start_codon:yes stop_codon:yes gene_type:complete